MSFDRWREKENVVYSYNGTLFSHEKEGKPAICNNTDKSGRHYAQ